MAASASPGRLPGRSPAYSLELQRARLLSATFALVGERGYEGVSARSVSERAGVSSRTFYEVFSDREDCFLAAFDHAIDGLEMAVRPAYESQDEWVAKIRGGLAELLATLEREPAMRRLVFVEALAAGPRVLARRARVLKELAGVIDKGRAGTVASMGLPELTAAAVVGATFGVIHARLLEASSESLGELLGALMATIVLPYRGSAAAARELERPTLEPSTRVHPRESGVFGRSLGSASPVDYRLTARARMALAAVAERPDLNNREVSEIIGLADQGQISRMMKRLAERGLVEDAQSGPRRMVRAWRLTVAGKAVIGEHEAARAGFRMTALTHNVLGAVASLCKDGVDPTNRDIARATGVRDEGQISKLLARLQGRGLIENTGGPSRGGNAWRLACGGEELLLASRPGVPRAAR